MIFKFKLSFMLEGFASHENAIVKAIEIIGHIKGLLNAFGLDCRVEIDRS